MDIYEGRRILSMLRNKRTAMALALGMLLVLFSTAFAAAPAQASMSRTASAPTTSQQLQFGWSGWSEVPGNGLTPSAPAVSIATIGPKGSMNLFVRGTNNKIYVNYYTVGWSGWSEVPGNGLTIDSPEVLGNHLFVRGTNDRIYVNILHMVG
jgi:hypothetical protein